MKKKLFLCFVFMFGMSFLAFGLGLTITYTEDETGLTYTDSYHRAEEFFINAEKASIRISIYSNKTNFQAGKAPYDVQELTCRGDDYNTFFKTALANATGKTLINLITTQVYAYLQSLDPAEEDACLFDYKNDSTLE